MENQKKTASLSSVKTKRLIYYVLGLTLPLTQFFLMYVVVNFNSILLAFETYEFSSGSYILTGFNNFKDVFQAFVIGDWLHYILRGLAIYLLTVAEIPFVLLFSFYFVKKKRFHKTFEFILMLPSMISGLVLSLMFKYFVSDCLPALKEIFFGVPGVPLLDTGNDSTTFAVITAFSIYLSFGGNLLIYSGAMSGVSDSVVEAAQIDGVNPFQEFLYIYFPLIWPTISTLLVMGLAGVLVADIGLYSYFGATAKSSLRTLGYELTVRTQTGDLGDYPFVAAMGLCITFVSVPIVFGGKALLKKVDDKFSA